MYKKVQVIFCFVKIFNNYQGFNIKTTYHKNLYNINKNLLKRIGINFLGIVNNKASVSV